MITSALNFQKGENNSFFGRKHSEASKELMRKAKLGLRGEDTSNWRGDKAEYRALHTWVQNTKGKASCCVVCASSGGKERGCHWANLDGEYNRNANDFVSLCPSCHRLWDLGRLPVNLFEWVEKGGCYDSI